MPTVIPQDSGDAREGSVNTRPVSTTTDVLLPPVIPNIIVPGGVMTITFMNKDVKEIKEIPGEQSMTLFCQKKSKSTEKTLLFHIWVEPYTHHSQSGMTVDAWRYTWKSTWTDGSGTASQIFKDCTPSQLLSEFEMFAERVKNFNTVSHTFLVSVLDRHGVGHLGIKLTDQKLSHVPATFIPMTHGCTCTGVQGVKKVVSKDGSKEWIAECKTHLDSLLERLFGKGYEHASKEARMMDPWGNGDSASIVAPRKSVKIAEGKSTDRSIGRFRTLAFRKRVSHRRAYFYMKSPTILQKIFMYILL